MDETNDVERAAEIVDSDAVDDHKRVDKRRVRITAAEFSGPLPPPNILGEYNKIVPGLAREMVDQWKTETAHRHRTIDGLRAQDERAMDAYYAAEKRGQTLAFLLFLGVVGLVALAIVLDSDPIGLGALLLAGVAVVVEMRRRKDPPDAKDAGDGDEIEKS